MQVVWHASFCSSVCASLHPSVSPSLCCHPTISLSLRPSVHPSLYPCKSPSLCPSAPPSPHPSVPHSVPHSVCPAVHWHNVVIDSCTYELQTSIFSESLAQCLGPSLCAAMAYGQLVVGTRKSEYNCLCSPSDMTTPKAIWNIFKSAMVTSRLNWKSRCNTK